MAAIIEMPKLGFNMDEGTLVKWYKKEGEAVIKGEPLFSIETDKTAIDIEATEDGIFAKKLVEEGEVVPVFTPIGAICAEGEDVTQVLAGKANTANDPVKKEESEKQPAERENGTPDIPQANASSVAVVDMAEFKISPRASRIAKQQNLDMNELAAWAAPKGAPVQEADLERFIRDICFRAGLNGRGEPRVTPRARRRAQEMDIPIQAMSSISGTGFQGGIGSFDVETFAKTYDPESLQRILITPLAKRIAEDNNIDLAEISGSGFAGKIKKQDIMSALASKQAPAPETSKKETKAEEMPGITPSDGAVAEVIPYKSIRQVIGERLAQSWNDAPHIFFSIDINMDKVIQLRKEVNALSKTKHSMTDFLVKAVALTLQDVPIVNASLRGDKIYRFKSINIGVAVAAPTGLIVPVIREVQDLSLTEIAEASSVCIDKARNGKLLPADYSGGTFTISNMGMYGVSNFTAVVNPPESGILAVGATVKKPVVVKNDDGEDEIRIASMMTVTLSVDHRVVDGEFAGIFVRTLREKLENPLLLLM